MEKPQTKQGIARIINAFKYSRNGLLACYRNEEAFRQESIMFIILLPVIILIPVAPVLKLFLFTANSLVLIVELLNSAIEAVVDKVSPEFHTLAERAKDMGSAAVLLSLILAGVVWAAAVFDLLF